ncbi:DODA-type extradiol aromatic ring-opening family dioxygenase [uncultured Ilyobacter sp.]|uniref:DODA-type extradiol aromatic ring-opening family dioxygenase n=1 Tax=uncultured Ilyobacter sp. TaxID=544433 RepID=UPI003748E8FE
MPLLGDPNHAELIEFMKTISNKLRKPSAIVVISAHWEERIATITGAEHPKMIYDYSGFPEESYKIKYNAPGNPELAKEVLGAFNENGILAKKDDKRGYDHGLFIPLMLMYPDANIPCIQISQLKSLEPREHIALGKALAKLMEKNILVVGSGLSFHNMREFFHKSSEADQKAIEFNNWLIETCTDENISENERERRLSEWEKTPSGRFCHPREEHLLPLHVCFGIATANNFKAELVFDDLVIGKRASAFLWKEF